MSIMEVIIVAAVVLIATLAVVSLFRKSLSGKSGCGCCSAEKFTDNSGSCCSGAKEHQHTRS